MVSLGHNELNISTKTSTILILYYIFSCDPLIWFHLILTVSHHSIRSHYNAHLPIRNSLASNAHYLNQSDQVLLYHMSSIVQDKLKGSTVQCRYNDVWDNMILHTSLQELRTNFNQRLNLQKNTPYLALTGELWDGFCEYFGENWPHYNGTTLDFLNSEIDHIFLDKDQSNTLAVVVPVMCHCWQVFGQILLLP